MPEKVNKAYKDKTLISTVDLSMTSEGRKYKPVKKKLTNQQLEDNYSKCEWVRIGVDDPAYAIYASGYHFAPLRGIQPEEGDDKEMLVLYRFFEQVNEEDTIDDLILSCVMDLNLYGNAYWQVETSAKDEVAFADQMRTLKDKSIDDIFNLVFPFKLYHISAKNMTPSVSQNAKTGEYELNGYIQEVPGFYVKNKNTSPTYSVDEIVHFKLPTPIESVEGLSPGATLETTVDADKDSANYNAKFFKNNGTPRLHIDLGDVTEKQMERFLAFMEKYLKGQPHKNFVTRKGVKINPVGLKNADMEFNQYQKSLRERGLGVYRVPPFIAGIIEGGDRSASEQITLFKFLAVKPPQKLVAGRINKKIINRFFPSFKQRFVFNEVDDLDLFKRAEIDGSDLTHLIKNRNEVRQERGYPSVKGGHRFIMPRGAATYEDAIIDDGDGDDDKDNGKKKKKKDEMLEEAYKIKKAEVLLKQEKLLNKLLGEKEDGNIFG